VTDRCNGRFGADGARRCRRQAVIVVPWSQAAMHVCWGADWNTARVCSPCNERINRIATKKLGA
jgi:hypothetical protein